MSLSVPEAIAEANTANRCQAGWVSPAGTGVSQMPIAITNGSACLRNLRGFVMAEMRLRQLHSEPARIGPCH